MVRVMSYSGIAQLHVEVRFAGDFHFDQVAKTEHLELVAVLHQHVEVRIDEARLVSIRDLERHRVDAVLAVGFVFGFGILRRIDDFDVDLAVARDFELL